VDPLTRALAVLLLLLAFTQAGCGGDGEPVAPAEPTPVSKPVEQPKAGAPALPAGVLLQLFVPDTGELYRIGEDGRFTVGDQPEQPRSKFEPGRQTVSPRGLDRLRAALDSAGFFSLPPRIATGDCVSDGSVIRNSGRKVLRRTVVVSAREGERVTTVEGLGDFGAPCTLAELEPIYRALDLEALGDWQNG
jgi:hypothetical protein